MLTSKGLEINIVSGKFSSFSDTEQAFIYNTWALRGGRTIIPGRDGFKLKTSAKRYDNVSLICLSCLVQYLVWLILVLIKSILLVGCVVVPAFFITRLLVKYIERQAFK